MQKWGVSTKNMGTDPQHFGLHISKLNMAHTFMFPYFGYPSLQKPCIDSSLIICAKSSKQSFHFKSKNGGSVVVDDY